jgi:uncharacterized protein YhaN
MHVFKAPTQEVLDHLEEGDTIAAIKAWRRSCVVELDDGSKVGPSLRLAKQVVDAIRYDGIPADLLNIVVTDDNSMAARR